MISTICCRSTRNDIIMVTVIMMEVVYGLGQPRSEFGRVGEVPLVFGSWGSGGIFSLGENDCCSV